MIDTIKIKVSEHQINSDISKIQGAQVLSQEKIDNETGEALPLRDSIVLNHPEGFYRLQTGKHSRADIFIDSEPSVYITGSNYYPISQQGFCNFIDFVEQDLKQRGLKIDLSECSVSRLDIFNQAEMSRDLTEYIKALDSAGSLRKHFNYRAKSNDSYICFMSSAFKPERVFRFYDKVRALIDKKQFCPESIRALNTIRGEYSLQSKRKVVSQLGIEKVSDIMNDTGFQDIKNRYIHFIETYIEPVIFQEPIYNLIDKQDFKYFTRKQKEETLSLSGFMYLAKVQGIDFDFLNNIFKDNGVSWYYREKARAIYNSVNFNEHQESLTGELIRKIKNVA